MWVEFYAIHPAVSTSLPKPEKWQVLATNIANPFTRRMDIIMHSESGSPTPVEGDSPVLEDSPFPGPKPGASLPPNPLSLMIVKVKLFATYQEAYQVEELNLNFAPGTPVKAVLDYLLREKPELEKWRAVTRFGINLEFVEPDTPMEDGDEVVLIPPVSGG
jgi:molybdopterin synthase sulfur carrier subunit